MPTTTTLTVVCAAFGCQGGTIHQVKERFAIASMQEMDRVCNALIGVEVSDPETKLYFFRKRIEAINFASVAKPEAQEAVARYAAKCDGHALDARFYP